MRLPPDPARPIIAEFACIDCHTEMIRVVSETGRYVYLRCDGCGQVFSMPERRVDLPHAIPLKATLRRVADRMSRDTGTGTHPRATVRPGDVGRD